MIVYTSDNIKKLFLNPYTETEYREQGTICHNKLNDITIAVKLQKDVFENNREYAYGDYIFSYMPIYDFKDDCYVLNVGCIENVQLNNKEDIMADFNYIVESIKQLNNETKNEIDKIKSQYNCHHKNSISIFTKIKNLFKNK